MPDPLPRTHAIVTAVALLSMSSGLVDAVVYTLHGHVFAYAMTGNLVLLGVALSTRNPTEIAHHVLPLLGFAAGVVMGKVLLRFHRFTALQITLLLQILVFAVLGSFASHISSAVVVSLLSISGAVLITTIRRVGDIPLNITFMTGNLRALTEGAFDAILPRTSGAENRGVLQARLVGLGCIGFLSGAALGAMVLLQLRDRSFWVAGAVLIPAAWLLRRANTSTEG